MISIDDVAKQVTGKSGTQNKTEKSTSDGSGVRHVNSQCKIVVYPWIEKDVSSLNEISIEKLADSRRFDVTSRMLGVTYSKNINNPAGNFTFTLANNTGLAESDDWKDIIKPGTWCAIYLSQDGGITDSDSIELVTLPNSKLLRCMGYIERVAVKSELTETGAYDAVFEFSGRDFGVIYEETTIWRSLYEFDSSLLTAIQGSKLQVVGRVSLDQIISEVHDLFFKPQGSDASLNDEESLTAIARQWLLPAKMLQDLNIKYTGSSFFGNIKNLTQIEPTKATMSAEQPLDFIEGAAWEKLKSIAVPGFHEMFCETDDLGIPHFKFRPTPWAIDKSKYPKAGEFIAYYRDLKPRVTINDLDMLRFDLGEDDHNRKSHFLVLPKNTIMGSDDSVSILNSTRFPLQNVNSVRRHGFRPVHSQINSLNLIEVGNADGANVGELKEFNEIMYDYWRVSESFESGTLEIIGKNEIKVGKTIQFDDQVPYMRGKIFYIEGYTDTIQVEPNGGKIWVQTLEVTRGVEEDDLLNNSGFLNRAAKTNTSGDFT